MRTRNVLLWAGFVLVHVQVVVMSLTGTGNPLVDVTDFYQVWAVDAVSGGPLVGIESPWVYPLLALGPILLPLIGGAAAYPVSWLVFVSLLDAVAFALLVGRATSPRRVAAAWWWLGFTAALGPISVGRLDAVTVPLSIVAVLVVVRRPGAAAVLLAIATWIKVWPAALIASAVIAVHRRVRIIVVAAIVSALTAGTAVVLGASSNLFSFLALQSGRGLQVEAPVSLFYLWQSALGVEGSSVYFDDDIITFQVAGPGADAVAAVMTPLLLVCVAGVVLVGVLATRAGAPVVRVLPPLSLAFVLVLIAVNKVGSPQYLVWLVAPIVLGIVWRGRRFAFPAASGLVLAFLTHVVYPYLYALLRDGAVPMVSVITVRNVGYLVVLWWCVAELLRARREALSSERTAKASVAARS